MKSSKNFGTSFKTILLLITAGIAGTAFSQTESFPKWNGYLQTRLSTDFNNTTEFIIRRAKLWVYGNLPKANYISYKFQMVYRSFKDDALMFQDAYADIRLKNYGMLRTGRFVPDFMLQRMQPDYLIPVMERASVINSLVHNEKQMAREIGIQYTFQSDSLPWHFSVGIFNANIDKSSHGKDNSLLSISRLVYKIINRENTWVNIGGSLAYRHLKNTSLTTIYVPDSIVSGNDFRWGIETLLHYKSLEVQGEYVQANINSDKAFGWYAMANYTFFNKYQTVVLTEKYVDLNPYTQNNKWYGLGINYLIAKNSKIMADFKIQNNIKQKEYRGDIQLQIFFN